MKPHTHTHTHTHSLTHTHAAQHNAPPRARACAPSPNTHTVTDAASMDTRCKVVWSKSWSGGRKVTTGLGAVGNTTLRHAFVSDGSVLSIIRLVCNTRLFCCDRSSLQGSFGIPQARHDVLLQPLHLQRPPAQWNKTRKM